MLKLIYSICLYGAIPTGLIGLFTLSPLTIAAALVMGIVVYCHD